MKRGVSKTALMVARCNRDSGIPYCDLISQMSDADEVTREMFGDNYKQTILKNGCSMTSLCHQSLTAMVRLLGIKKILEIACGLDPRGFILTEDKSYNVVETDFPEMILLKQELAWKLFKDRSNHRLIAADATDAIQVAYAASFLGHGAIAMVCAGLVSYCPLAKKRLIVRAFEKEISLRPGSVWLATSEDFITKSEIDRYLNDEVGRIIIETLCRVSGQDLAANAFIDHKDIANFLGDHRLRYDRIKQISLVRNFGQDLDEATRQKLATKEIFVIRQAA